MTTTRIGVVTDTHVGDELPALPNEVLERLAEVDLVVHAGDLVEPDILQDLARVAPVIAVRGNHDRNRSLPHSALLRVGGHRIAVVHGIRPAPIELGSALAFTFLGRLDVNSHCRALARLTPPADLVVFGHIHIPVDRTLAGTRFYSPGPVYQPELDPDFSWEGVPRRMYRRLRQRIPAHARRPAIGLLEVSTDGIAVQTIYLDRPIVPGGPATGVDQPTATGSEFAR
jgi:putative phosphoesterase